LAIVLPAQLPAVLPCHSRQALALSRKSAATNKYVNRGSSISVWQQLLSPDK